jgi:hypothetical protein
VIPVMSHHESAAALGPSRVVCVARAATARLPLGSTTSFRDAREVRAFTNAVLASVTRDRGSVRGLGRAPR